MSSKESVKTPGTQPSGRPGTGSRVCVICRRVIARDGIAIDIHNVSVHVGCAAYRRQRARR
jgi:hypothetical protein